MKIHTASTSEFIWFVHHIARFFVASFIIPVELLVTEEFSWNGYGFMILDSVLQFFKAINRQIEEEMLLYIWNYYHSLLRLAKELLFNISSEQDPRRFQDELQ